MAKKEEKVWIIVNPLFGAYVDWRLRRGEIIDHHCSDTGDTWKECKERGDRAVEATLTYNL